MHNWFLPASIVGLACLCGTELASAQCEPSVLGQWSAPGAIRDLAVEGDIAFVLGDTSLSLVDVSDPMNPMLLGSLSGLSSAWGVDVSGGLAGIADGAGGLRVVDVSDPMSPVIVGTLPSQTLIQDVAVSGSIACVTELFIGIRVVDLAIPSSPQSLATVPTCISAGSRVFDDGVRVFAACTGLVQVSIANPSAPVLLGPIAGLDPAVVDLDVEGSRLYVVGEPFPVLGGGMTPPQLSRVPLFSGSVTSEVLLPSAPAAVAASSDTVLVSLGSDGISVYDDPGFATPALIGGLATPGAVSRIEFRGSTGYMADSTGVLMIGDFLTCFDTDDDGFNDAIDVCLLSDLRPTVWINECDTGVPNPQVENGCTLADLLSAFIGTDPTDEEFSDYVASLRLAGFMTGRQQGAIIRTYHRPRC